MRLRNTDSDHVLDQVRLECFTSEAVFGVKEVDNWKFEVSFAELLDYFSVEGLEDDWKSILMAFLFCIQIACFEYLDNFLDQNFIPAVFPIFPEALYFDQEPTLVFWQTLFFYVLDFSECLLERRDFESETIQLRPLLKGLFYLQLV